MGSIYRRGGRLWIKYYRNGCAMRESTGTDKEGIAKNLLQQREGDIARGVPVTPQTNRCTIDDLLADVVNDYVMQGHKSVEKVRRRISLHLEPFFGGRKAANVTTDVIRTFIVARQRAKA